MGDSQPKNSLSSVLAPPSLQPLLKGTRLPVQGKTSRKAAALAESQEALLEREGQDGEPPGDAKHSTGGLVPACPPASGKEGFPAPAAHSPALSLSGGVGTEPHTLSLPSTMVAPADSLLKQSS